MRRLIPFLLLLWAFPATAGNARLGSCSGATSCTPSATGVFALEVAFAYHTASTTAPTNAAWTLIGTEATSTGGTTGVMAAFCRVSYSSTAAASGTFANTSDVGIVTYSGTGARATQDCSTVALTIGGSSTTYLKTSTTVSYNTITMSNSSGSSWVIGAMGDSTSGNVCTPTGMTVVSGATTGDISVSDTNAGVSSWATTTCTVTSSTWVSYVLEIIVPPASPPTLSQLVNGSGGMGNRGTDGTINNVRYKMDPTLSGNTEVIFVGYTYSASRTLSIVDDKSDSATLGASCNDTSAGLSFASYYIPNLTAGATTITYTFDAAIANFTEMHFQFSGPPSTSLTEGTPSCTVNITPSGNALGNLADPTGTTPVSNGDLVVSGTFDEGGGAFEGNNTIYDVVFGSGYTGLLGETSWGAAAQAQIQSTAGNIKPSLLYTQTSHDAFAVMTIAFKISAGGTARTSGKIIRMTQTTINSNIVFPMNWVLPCDAGNFIEITFENNSGVSGTNITAVADTAANTYASQNPGGANYPQFWNATNATCNGQLFGFINGGTPAATRVTIYELPNALTSSAIDASATTHATFTTAAATTLSAAVTSAGQTSFSLAAAGGIANGDYLMVSTEVVKVTAGGGTTSITVTRAQFGTTALGTIASGTNVVESLQSPQPAVTTAAANEVVFGSMNQSTGPNWDTANSTYDFGSAIGNGDLGRLANGDGNCHTYEAAAGTYNLGWYLSDGGITGDGGNSSAIAVKLAAAGTSTTVPQLMMMGVG